MQLNNMEDEEANKNSNNVSELTIVAYHEASHAVVEYLLKIPIKKISIIPDELKNALGYVENIPTYHKKINPATMTLEYQVEKMIYWTENRKMKFIKSFLAGDIAEDILRGEIKEDEEDIIYSSSDYDMALTLAENLCGSLEEVCALLNYLWWNVYNTLTLDYNWFLVEALAFELLEKKEISGRQLKNFLKEKEEEYRKSKRKVS